MGDAFFSNHHVYAVPEAVDEVDICVAGRAEHDLVAGSSASGGVCGEVLRPLIGLNLDDSAYATGAVVVMHQMHAEQIPRDDQCAASVELPGQGAHPSGTSTFRRHCARIRNHCFRPNQRLAHQSFALQPLRPSLRPSGTGLRVRARMGHDV